MVSGIYLVLGGIAFSFITWLLIGYASIGIALVLLTLLHMTRFLLGRLQRLKYGKPYGYYQQLFLKHLTQNAMLGMLWKTRLVNRRGRWSVRRM